MKNKNEPLFKEILMMETDAQLTHPAIHRITEAGYLHIATHSIVACGIKDYQYDKPFTRKVPNGDFMVKLYHTAHEGVDDYFSLAVVVFNENPIVRWENALIAGQNEDELAEGEYFCYQAGGFLACFKDEIASKLYARQVDSFEYDKERYGDDNFEAYYRLQIANEIDDNFCNHIPDHSQPNNVMMFGCYEYADAYSSYFGLDASGEPVCLVTDLQVLADFPFED